MTQKSETNKFHKDAFMSYMEVQQNLQMDCPNRNDVNTRQLSLSVASVNNSCTDYDLSNVEEEALMDEYEKEMQKQSLQVVHSWITKQCKFDDFEEDSSVKNFELKLADHCRRFPFGPLQSLNKSRFPERPRGPKKVSPPQMSSHSSRACGGQVSDSPSNACDLLIEVATISDVSKNFVEDIKSPTAYFDERRSIHNVEEIVGPRENSLDYSIEPAFEFNIDKLLPFPSNNADDSETDEIKTIVAAPVDELPVERSHKEDVQEKHESLRCHCIPEVSGALCHVKTSPLLDKNEHLEKLVDEFKRAVQIFWSTSEVFSQQINRNNAHDITREIIE